MDRNLTPRYYRVRDLQTIFGKPTVKATRSIYRQPGFPDPIRIGREYLWRIDAVERFIADHPTGRVQRAPRPSPRASRPVAADVPTDQDLPLIVIGRAKR